MEEPDNVDIFDYIEKEDKAKIQELLTKKLKIWIYRSNDHNNSTVLHLSVFKNLLDITEELIEYVKVYNNDGLIYFINEKNNLGESAIHYAALRGNTKIIKLLIENGADPFSMTNQRLNVFHYSCQGNSKNSLMFFYLHFKQYNKRGLKLITEGDVRGSTPLHCAAYSNAEDALLYLINSDIFRNEREREDYINLRNKEGYTALHLSSISSNNKSDNISKILLQKGANSDIRDNKGRTASILALVKKQREIEIERKNRREKKILTKIYEKLELLKYCNK